MLCFNGNPADNNTTDFALTAELKPDFSIYSVNFNSSLIKIMFSNKNVSIYNLTFFLIPS